MAATVLAYIYNGTGPTAGSAEGGVTWGLDDNVVSTAVLPIPNAAGTNFSYAKTFALYVTGGTATNHITNRRVQLAAALAAGLHEWWLASATYAQATAAASATTTANGSSPTGYTGEVTTAASLYDNTSVVTAVGINGQYCRVALGVDNLYTGGGGSAALSSLQLVYDEGP